MSIHNPGDQKTGIYPFKTQNILPGGKEIIVKSHKHRKQLMKQYGLHDDKVSLETQNKRRRWFEEQQKKERRSFMEKVWYEAKRGKIDLRPYDLARKKLEYERRNGK